MKQLDDCSKKYLHLLYKKGYAKIPTLSADNARDLFSGSRSAHSKPNKTIDISYNDKCIPLHIYFPTTKKINSIIVFFHSGGYVLRQSSLNANLCRRIADKTQSCVILVEYSLSPEVKFPQAIYEATAAIDWVNENKINLTQQKNCNVFLCGESSGANLVVSSLLNKKHSNLNGLILVCPSLDYYNTYPSKEEYKTGYLLDKEVRAWFAKQYLNNLVEKSNPLISPILSDKLDDLSNVLIINSYFDPLRDESIQFKNKLDQYGVKNYIETFDTIHGFIGLNIEPYSSNALNTISDFINHTV